MGHGNKKACPVCSSSEGIRGMGQYKNKNAEFEGKQLLKCAACGVIFIYPMPSKEELDNYYRTTWLGEGSVMSVSPDSETVYGIQAVERAKYLDRKIGLRAGMKVLDIGSGYGMLIEALEKFGVSRDSFTATDPSPKNIERLRNRNIRAFPDIKDVQEKDFDVACACFVLEHVPDPLGFLGSIRGRVREGGYLFIDIPERDDTFKEVLEPHVFVYTKDSLKNTLERSGFKVLHMTGYGIKRSDIKTGLFKKIVRKIKGIFSSKKTGLYDQFKFDQEGDNRWWVRAIAQKA